MCEEAQCVYLRLHLGSQVIDFQEVQEAQRVPKKLDPKRNTPRHIIIKLTKMKSKELILKANKRRGHLERSSPG